MVNDDIDFKQAMRGVRRLHQPSTSTQKPVKSLNTHKLNQEISQRAATSQIEHQNPNRNSDSNIGKINSSGDQQLYFLRKGWQDKVLRELKKGKRYPVDHMIDLHGLTRLKAMQLVDATLSQLPNNELICLLIIHGKGLHSSDGAPLKTAISEHLAYQHIVKAYCSAQPHDGGTGALYVLIKST